MTKAIQVLYLQQLVTTNVYTFAMAEGPGNPTPPLGAAARKDVTCILWHAPAASLRSELIAALRRPHFTVRAFSDPFSATAHSLRAHAESVESKGGLVVLLLVDPHQLQDVSEVVETMRHAAPGVVLWVFDSSEGPQLRALKQGELRARPAGGPITPTPEASPQAASIAGTGSTLGDAPRGLTPNSVDRLLTNEELGMLLDIEPGDERVERRDPIDFE